MFGNLKRCGFNVVSVTDIDTAKLAKYEGKVRAYFNFPNFWCTHSTHSPNIFFLKKNYFWY